MNDHEVTKLCKVCGDDMLVHFNFSGQVTCQSCKKFFKRTTRFNKFYKCKSYTGSCRISLNNRFKCKHCRYQRCIEIGMRLELKTKGHSSANIAPSISSSSSPSNFQLKPFEKLAIKEIQSAMSILDDEYSCNMKYHHDNQSDFVKIINMQAWFIKRVVQICDRIAAFKVLKQEDQLALLKGFYPRMSAIHAAFIYDVEKDSFPVIMDEAQSERTFVKLDFYVPVKNQAIVPTFRKFIIELKAALENDCTMRDLLICQLLFDQTENISCPEFIKYNYLKIGYLLIKYLQQKYSDKAKAYEKYVQLIEILHQMDPINEVIREVYANDIGKFEIAQVLAEIYDLI